MSWFRDRRQSAGDRPEREAEEGAGEPARREEESHLSPALAEAFGDLEPESPLHVLDLGPAVGENLTFLSQRYRCRLQVGDLFRSAIASGQPFTDPDADARRLFAQLLPAGEEGAPSERRIDLVLAWDLLDYLRRDQVVALSERLAAMCRPGGRIYALVHIGKEVPREPRSYVLRDGGELLYRGPTEPSRPATRYRPAEVDAMTPGFIVDRTYLLRHGVQEYLLERSGESLNDTPTESPPRKPHAPRP